MSHMWSHSRRQRIPRGRQPVHVSDRLGDVLSGWTIHTAGGLPNGPHIDHIATDRRLVAELVADWPASDRVGRLSDRSCMTEPQWQEGLYLDDRAKAGKWETVLEILRPDNHSVNINQWCPGSDSRSTVLHRAAENGAPVDVVEALLALGAFRSQQDSSGMTPHQIAERNGSTPEVLDLYRPDPSPLDPERITVLDSYLGEALDWWFGKVLDFSNPRNLLCYNPVGVLHEPPGQELWIQQPRFSGGARVVLRWGYLEVLMGFRDFQESGTRVVTYGCVVTQVGWAHVYESDSAPPPPKDESPVSR